jgi:hypothetical protein
MILNKQHIVDELRLKPFGAKNWLRSDLCKCPNCNTSDKFGILFTSDGALVRCFKDLYSTSLYNYLKIIGHDDLIQLERNFSLNKELLGLSNTNISLEEKQAIKNLPLGYKRIYYDDYLEERGFESWQYNQYEVGTSTERRLKDCLIFVIRNKQKQIIAWLSRSKESKEWHVKNFKDYKTGKCALKLRYQNSENTNFSTILLGENEITENTTTVYLVEGIMDKSNVDRKLNLRDNEEIKCLVCFGNSLTVEQEQILIRYNIQNTLFLWDEGTNSSSKRASMKASKHFKNIRVAEFKNKDIDAGASTKTQLENAIKNSIDYFAFYINRMNEMKLK